MLSATINALNFQVKATVALLTLGLLTLSGCGEKNSLIQATGKVTVDGQPAEGVILVFHAGSGNSVPTGKTKADGSYTLATDAKPGIPEGTYQVTANWPDPKANTSSGGPTFGSDSSDDGPTDLLKGRYINRQKSGLSITVNASSTELGTLDLTTK